MGRRPAGCGRQLRLSIGSPTVGRQLRADPDVTVHLDSGTDVVIVEARARVGTEEDTARWVATHDAKYAHGDGCSVAEYGPLTPIMPTPVMAWRSGGWAGREGFPQTGRWRFA